MTPRSRPLPFAAVAGALAMGAVLGLLDALDAAEAERDRLRKALEYISTRVEYGCAPTPA